MSTHHSRENKVLKHAIRPFFFIGAPRFLFNLKNKNCILHHFTFLVDAQHAKKSLPKTSYFHPNRPL